MVSVFALNFEIYINLFWSMIWVGTHLWFFWNNQLANIILLTDHSSFPPDLRCLFESLCQEHSTVSETANETTLLL